MFTLYKNEIKKLIKRPRYLIIYPVVTFLVQIFVAYLIKYHTSLVPSLKGVFINGLAGGTFIAMYMIIASVNLVVDEFKNKTCNVLFSHGFSRTEIYFSKIVALIVYNFYLSFIIYFSAIIIKQCFNLKLTLSRKLVIDIIKYAFSFDLSLWIILLFIILLSIILKNSTFPSVIGVLLYFVPSILGNMLTSLIRKFEWLKFNPINMQYLPAQTVYHSLHTVTHLSTTSLFWGNLIYVLMLLMLIIIFQYRDI